MKIICPYCFKEMEDDDVSFRSEKVNRGENDILPEEYSDIGDFTARYRGEDKYRILDRLQDWEFFKEGADPEYENFWRRFNGTTEYNPSDVVLGVKAYYRKVISPKNPEHQKYLKIQPDGTYFIRDNLGMVSQIELFTGEKCNRRVCRYCHNPLLTNYGKSPVKFITVIGITGAGKTIYLSQILKKMEAYITKGGLSATFKNTGVLNFIENNGIAVNKALPGSTPITQFQQPLFYEITGNGEGESKITNTLVLYDVAGEIFSGNDQEIVQRFAPFIEHANGIILLIDPMQFENISNVNQGGQTLSIPATALNTINTIISHGEINKRCEVPIAICISKIDTENVQNVLNQNLRGMLLNDVQGVMGDNGFAKTEFNAKDYNPIARDLNDFIRNNDMSLAQMLYTNYDEYNFFAFTALGCDVIDKEGGYYPVGPILPKRIEEPLLWLFNKFGYIGENEPIFDPKNRPKCPTCNSNKSRELPEDERTLKIGWFKKIHVNRECLECGHKWEYIPNKN